MKNASEIREDWANQRCSPKVLPFAGQINAPPGTSHLNIQQKILLFVLITL